MNGSTTRLWPGIVAAIGASLVGAYLLRGIDAPPAPVAAPVAVRSAVRVHMYSTSWCHYCKAARAWLDQNGVSYDDYDVERDQLADERMRAINPRGGVPTFDVDGQVAVGFDAGQLTALLERAAKRHGATQ